jgi:hypothetical protein
LSGLNENELEKLLVDTKLDEKFKDKIITDVKI